MSGKKVKQIRKLIKQITGKEVSEVRSLYQGAKKQSKHGK
jgi:hypothetical protein